MPLELAGDAQRGRGKRRRVLGTSSQGSEKSFLKDDFFSRRCVQKTGAAEGSRPPDTDLLQTEKTMEDTEAELPGRPRMNCRPRKTPVKAVFPRQQKMLGPAVQEEGCAPLCLSGSPRSWRQSVWRAPRCHIVPQAESADLDVFPDGSLKAPTAQLHKDASGYHAELLRAQSRVAELESQVRTLKMEQTQYNLRLEKLQQHHREELDHLKSTYRRRLKVLGETYEQQQQSVKKQNEQLVAQLLSQSQDAEKARAELVAQHEERVAALQQQNMWDLECLREQQRTLFQTRVKDYEEQLQRLRQTKDLEVDAVTGPTSHTRSLNSIMEQMEKFSSELRDFSHKVEAMHQTVSQELAQQQDKQLKVLEDRLSQQQRDMEEERSHLQKVITQLRSRLNKQSTLLEQEQSRLVSEQAQVELQQHSQEEQQQGMSQQLSKEQAELEGEKSALLEEQQKLEHNMDRTLQTASERERATVSLAKEQAELKAREDQLRRDRELLEEAWQELRREKEKVHRAALHIQLQEKEIKSMTNQSSQKYKEGEQALQEAGRIESEHQSRLQVMQERFEQERLSMARQRRQLKQLREGLRRNPVTPLTAGKDLGAPMRGLSGTLRPAILRA
ncbi:fas-binding factor 1 homolog [Strigops habroptila]|uniref:fas-binding factor 1 homolog n=1 Tax=Strigops habroptila TaxID=2489341 RepID=UPI0011CF3A6B|nr:fas-binding factor 1 homolog [Strigops habroptila]